MSDSIVRKYFIALNSMRQLNKLITDPEYHQKVEALAAGYKAAFEKALAVKLEDDPVCAARMYDDDEFDIICDLPPDHDGDHSATYTWER